MAAPYSDNRWASPWDRRELSHLDAMISFAAGGIVGRKQNGQALSG